MKIGILALQGAVGPHREKLQELGVEPVEVRTPEDLKDLAGIILPGGESSAMIHLLKLNSLWEPLSQFVDERPAWGVCAGSILLASEVLHPAQASLKKMHLRATRNAYGRQLDSFIAILEPSEFWPGDKIEGVFIRAPRLEPMRADVQVLFRHNGEPVMIQEGHWLASAFHPELSLSTSVHKYFINLCEGRLNHGRTIS